MSNAPIPIDEEQRILELESFGVLDTERDERFDRLTRLATTLFDVPFALVSLVDRKRQWFKSASGLDLWETPRDALAFCAHAIVGDDVFVVENAAADERFCRNPFVVGDPKIRFYGGAALTSEGGHRLGTLCIIDTKPRTMDARERRLLVELAALVMDEMLLHKTLAALRHRTEAAEAAARGKGDFLAVMSHELRTPLNAVIGFAECLSSELYGPLGHPKYREYARLIGRGGTHLLDVIGNILDMTGAESDSTLALEPVDVRALVVDIVDVLGPVARGKRVALELRPTKMQSYVSGNPGAIRKVLLNVVGNAIKYSPEGSRVRLLVTGGAGDTIVRVEDSGIGIADADMKRLGEPFFRAGSIAMLANPVEGTGLGIAISKRLMGKMGGAFAIESELGKGTSVSLRFESADPPAAALAARCA
jgi:signal transduction histidine kinase